MQKESYNKYPNKVDLNNCDREPIHLIGQIQSHGVLIGGYLDTKKISRCSENCGIIFKQEANHLLDTYLANLLPNDIIDQLFNGLSKSTTNYVSTELNNINVEIIANLIETEFILEFEIMYTAIDPFEQQLKLNKMISTISSIRGFNELTDQMANLVKNNFGYDRVMIYQFDANWNGSVIAEAKEKHLESWLGLHYPGVIFLSTMLGGLVSFIPCLVIPLTKSRLLMHLY